MSHEHHHSEDTPPPREELRQPTRRYLAQYAVSSTLQKRHLIAITVSPKDPQKPSNAVQGDGLCPLARLVSRYGQQFFYYIRADESYLAYVTDLSTEDVAQLAATLGVVALQGKPFLSNIQRVLVRKPS